MAIMRVFLFFMIVSWTLIGCERSAVNAGGAHLLILGEKKHIGAKVLVNDREVTKIEYSVSGGPSAGVNLKVGTHVVTVEQDGKTLLKETYSVDQKSGELYATLPK
jgi:hypothetical protein